MVSSDIKWNSNLTFILPSVGGISVRLAERGNMQIGGGLCQVGVPGIYTEIGLVAHRIKKRGQLYHDTELKWELDDFAFVQPRKPSKRMTIPWINMNNYKVP